MKTNFLNLFNVILSALVGLLGVVSCDMRSKYEVPFATLQVSGEITDTDNRPLQDIKVQLKVEFNKFNDPQHYPYSEAVLTYPDGSYSFSKQHWDLRSDSVWVVATDLTGTYQADSVAKAVTPVRKKNSDTWDYGEAEVVADLKLKKSE